MSESRRPSSRPSRWAVLTMPVVTVFCRAKGLPMATTNSPGRRSAEWPSSSAGSFFWGGGREDVGKEAQWWAFGGTRAKLWPGPRQGGPQSARPMQGWLTLGGHQTQGWHSQRPQVSPRQATGSMAGRTERSGWAGPGGTAAPRSQGPLLTPEEVRGRDPEPQTLRTVGSIQPASPPVSGASPAYCLPPSQVRSFLVFPAALDKQEKCCSHKRGLSRR